MLYKIVNVKCIDGKIRPKPLKGMYCKYFRFSRGYFESGCCFGENRYADCPYYEQPFMCENYIPTKDVVSEVENNA